MINTPEFCPECNDALLFAGEWFVSKRVTTPVVDGRLCLHDVAVDFVLGCKTCSATVVTVSADAIAEGLST